MQTSTPSSAPNDFALLGAVARLASARSLDEVVAHLRACARAFIGADGIAIILSEGGQCRYVAEDAPSPLWTGQSFPLESCIPGLAMQGGTTIVIPDVFADPRVAHEAYAPTFVRSMAIAPIGAVTATAALGAYWAETGAPSQAQIASLETLAHVAATALENVRLTTDAGHNEAQLRAVLDSVSDCYYALDRSWNLVEFNRASELYFNLKRGDVLGKNLWDLFPAGKGRPYEDLCRAAMDRGERAWMETPSAFQQGRIVEIRTAPMQHGISVALTDITDRRKAEEELRAQTEELETRVKAAIGERESAISQLHEAQKTEALGQMAGGVAHDFNNLLMPILGGLELVRRRGVPDPRSERLIDAAIQSAERARTLVQRMLSFARRQPLQPRAVDVAKLIEGLRDLIATSVGARVRVVIANSPDVPSALADANQLELALINIVLNARDAMSDGGVLAITTEWFLGAPAGADAGEYVRVTIADTGTGMDAATLKRAVEPFFSTKGVGKGTGLGLSMVHGLAAQLGGALDLKSTAGVGSVVSLFLPVATQDADEAQQRIAVLDALSAGTILLVDDEDLVRASTSAMLEELGYAIIEARSAQEALALLEEGKKVDWLVTDHVMPGMTGADLARIVRQQRKDMRVLIISGYADVEDIAPDLPRLTKPFGLEDLAQRLAEVTA